MPRKKVRALRKGISDRVIERLREMIRSGIIWTDDGLPHVCLGDGDVWGLMSGCFFEFCLDFCTTEKDEETKKLLWEKLRDDIVREHVKFIPTTRPWAWWEWEKPEPLRMVEDPEDDEPIHETQAEYLRRLGLLTPEEKIIVRKYERIAYVSISQGDFGKCAPCWDKASTTASELDFDLNASIKFQKFWIPRALFFHCEHLGRDDYGIFHNHGRVGLKKRKAPPRGAQTQVVISCTHVFLLRALCS